MSGTLSPIYYSPMSLFGRKPPRQSLMARYISEAYSSPIKKIQGSPTKTIKGRPLYQIILLIVASSLTITGVAASVAITIRGNNSTVDNQLSLGVGQARAISCETSSTLSVDTTSQWDDNLGDFTLQRLDVSKVDPSCGGKELTLVVDMLNSPNVNVVCNLPASNAISGVSSSNYSQATFVFATSAFTPSLTGQYACGTFSYPLYMASISATAVQIK